MANGLKLWNEKPLIVNTDLALKVGLHEAIVLQQIHFWCQVNRKKRQNYYDGHYWTYNTFKKWQSEDFPFWHLLTVKRIFARLVKQGYVIKGNYNQSKMDRTAWYRLNGKAFADFDDSPLPAKLAEVKGGKVQGYYEFKKFKINAEGAPIEI